MNVDHITSIENLLRDFVERTMLGVFGADWFAKSGITDKRQAQLLARQMEDRKRRVEMPLERHRVIYYADICDIRTIILKYWNSHFNQVFHKRKTLEVDIDRLISFRNPDRHSRILTGSEHLMAEAISCSLTQQINNYLRENNEMEKYWPMIDRVVDSHGNNIEIEAFPKKPLIVGDRLTFNIEASNPRGGETLYRCNTNGSMADSSEWQQESHFEWTAEEDHIGRSTPVYFYIKSNAEYHANGDYDDMAVAYYNVLPRGAFTNPTAGAGA